MEYCQLCFATTRYVHSAAVAAVICPSHVQSSISCIDRRRVYDYRVLCVELSSIPEALMVTQIKFVRTSLELVDAVLVGDPCLIL